MRSAMVFSDSTKIMTTHTGDKPILSQCKKIGLYTNPYTWITIQYLEENWKEVQTQIKEHEYTIGGNKSSSRTLLFLVILLYIIYLPGLYLPKWH